MFLTDTYYIRSFEKGLLFENDEFSNFLGPGRYHKERKPQKRRVEVVSMRDPFFVNEQLDVIVTSGKLDGLAEVLDLADHERALVWIDGRFTRILEPGLHVIWTTQRKVRIERVDVRAGLFEHRDKDQILKQAAIGQFQVVDVPVGHVGLLVRDGHCERELTAGRYILWKTGMSIQILIVDMRARLLDITGQDVMTADRVTVRLNLLLGFQVVDARWGICRKGLQLTGTQVREYDVIIWVRNHGVIR